MTAIFLVFPFGQKCLHALGLRASLNSQRGVNILAEIVQRHPQDRILETRIAVAQGPSSLRPQLSRIEDDAAGRIVRAERFSIRNRAKQFRHSINERLQPRGLPLQVAHFGIERFAGFEVEPLAQFVNQVWQVSRAPLGQRGGIDARKLDQPGQNPLFPHRLETLASRNAA